MIDNLPQYIPIVFVATTILTLVIFYWSLMASTKKKIRDNSGKIVSAVVAWLILQALLTLNNVYSTDMDSIPPRIVLFGIFPMLATIIWLFFSETGRSFTDSLSIVKLAYLNLVRIPVEFVLLWLYLNEQIPKLMTFEGWNFDIIMGLTAPIIIYYGFIKRKINIRSILIWNVLGILLLIFIFIIALLSAPFPMQQLAFDQPNIGLLYFPFSWLPTFIVPLVILGHLISIRQLMKSKNHNDE